MSDPRLHGYWRSGAAYRVRIALGLKGITYRQVTHDLRKGAQDDPAYRCLAPQGLVPVLEADGLTLTQSPAILEWIEERWPAPPLLPPDRDGRAAVRAMAALIGCDVHPLNNLRVLQKLRSDFSASESQVNGWIAHWISEGFSALEVLVGRYGEGLCHGDRPSLADCYLVPQLYSAERFGVDLTPYPRLRAIGARMAALPAVQAAHPARQPDGEG
ncbi:maleylacetoacetate isomerase [Novosphingobium sp. KA1]|uniref:maleylacetoacetate isomerase n=1 Tax=Novosphingobium sp. (strain KA1) TaxID=164608 RepID=UPI001F5D0B9F|nr:maleylacetoacetate isomerase [Novosphingobium sp. KA1]